MASAIIAGVRKRRVLNPNAKLHATEMFDAMPEPDMVILSGLWAKQPFDPHHLHWKPLFCVATGVATQEQTARGRRRTRKRGREKTNLYMIFLQGSDIAPPPPANALSFTGLPSVSKDTTLFMSRSSKDTVCLDRIPLHEAAAVLDVTSFTRADSSARHGKYRSFEITTISDGHNCGHTYTFRSGW